MRRAMRKLWVQISMTISGIIALFVVIPLLVLVLLVEVGVLDEEQAGTGPTPTVEQSEAQVEEDSPLIIDLFEVAGIVALLGVAAGVLISWRLSKPISQLAEAASDIGSRDLSRRVEVKGSQEILDLAEAFNQMAADLERAETLRSNLMADVAHELRTPLTALEGSLRAALDQVYQLDEEGIAALYQQTRHLIGLVNDLHELAQAEAQQLPLNQSQVDLRPMIQETVALFESLAAEKGVGLACDLPNEVPLVTADTSRMRQVLHNLLSNALRHTPAGGTISLKVQTINNELALSVEDTGEGIAPEHIPYVFDRFYRTDRSRSRDTGGTGLGLAIVKAIVEVHQGRVTAVSKGTGRGSTFTVYLPLGS